MSALLSRTTLKGIRIALSVSESPDLEQLGLIEGHLRMALGEITRSVLVQNGSIAYGGYVKSSGYTAFLAQELKRYSRKDRPLLSCLSWVQHRNISLPEIEAWKDELGLFGKLVCLNSDGQEIVPKKDRGEEPVPEADANVVARSLTGLRRYMQQHSQARVLLGGRREGYQGKMPGLLEEALVTLEAEQPLFLAGGFGGITLDIIRAVKSVHADWLPVSTHAPASGSDLRTYDGLLQISQIVHKNQWKGLRNGLSDEENRRLAMTHRPSEVTALVSLGLGRIFASASNGQTH